MRLRVIQISFLFVLLSCGVLAHTNDRRDKVSPQQIERTVSADPGVTVSLCVMSGSVSVQGWDRNEVQVQSSHVGQMELKRLDGARASGPAAKLTVLMAGKGEGGRRNSGDCQAFGDLELMVPRGASVYVETGDGSIHVSEVATVYAKSQSGDIEIEKASRSVEAGSFGSDISIKDSSGRIAIKSVGGDLTAADIRANDSSDCFEATTISGDIGLDKVANPLITIRTVNGNVNFDGALTRGGQYNFNTTKGDVTLSLPSDASFRLNAKLAEDAELTSDFALTSENPSMPAPPARVTPPPAAHPKKPESQALPATPAATDPPLVIHVDPKVKMTVNPGVTIVKSDPLVVKTAFASRRVNAVYGTGDAMIIVLSFSGSLHLEKN
jgi:hypothetical protein